MSFFPFLLNFFFSSFLFIMSSNSNGGRSGPGLPSFRVGKSSHAAYTNANSYIRATDVEIDRCVRSWSVAECKTRYADMLDARRFGGMFSDSFNAFMVDHQNVRGNTNTGAWDRSWTLLRR